MAFLPHLVSRQNTRSEGTPSLLKVLATVLTSPPRLVFNASFVPIVYLFYPETAGRTLEDIEHYFRDHDNVLVFRDKEATSSKRPVHFIEKEETEIRRRSSVNPHAADLAARHNRFGSISMAEPLEQFNEKEDRFTHEEKV